jgi:hypothetical protein
MQTWCILIHAARDMWLEGRSSARGEYSIETRVARANMQFARTQHALMHVLFSTRGLEWFLPEYVISLWCAPEALRIINPYARASVLVHLPNPRDVPVVL